MSNNKNDLALLFIGISLIFPLFFQLNGVIYQLPTALADSGGKLMELPLPLALIGCFGGLLMLFKHIRRASVGLAYVGGMLCAMALSMALTGAPEGDRSKLLLLVQFLLPTFALVLGLQVDDQKRVIAKVFLYTLLIFVPLQLLAGWVQGSFTLTHNMHFFGIYQHFQYVPLIFVCAFSYAAATLWKSHRSQVVGLMALMAVYVVASVSFLTVFAYVAFMTGFFYFMFTGVQKRLQTLVVAPLLILVAAVVVLFVFSNSSETVKRYSHIPGTDNGYVNKFVDLSKGKIPLNIQERFDIWNLYGRGIVESAESVLVGHRAPLPRGVKTSAHNWYIDMVYNFGLLGLLPTILLTIYSLNLLRTANKPLSSEAFWLAVIVGYLVFLDNNFKVTLRQPYPGIFTYFMWGLLLSRLRPARLPS